MAYTQSFYSSRQEASRRSARAVLPFVLDLVKPKSVVDFGCGTGTWLAEAKALGVERVRGVEGAWIHGARSLLDPSELLVADLNFELSLSERFDLAISLEVAEHLGAARARGFVRDLCRAAPVVLFGAAIPDQGGTGHVNEQWQSYWLEHFEAEGYQCLDWVRPRFWHESEVLPWYKQNAFLYASESARVELAGRLGTGAPGPFAPMDVVHPELYTRLVRDPPLRIGARIAFRLAQKTLKAGLERLGGGSGGHD